MLQFCAWLSAFTASTIVTKIVVASKYCQLATGMEKEFELFKFSWFSRHLVSKWRGLKCYLLGINGRIWPLLGQNIAQTPLYFHFTRAQTISAPFWPKRTFRESLMWLWKCRFFKKQSWKQIILINLRQPFFPTFLEILWFFQKNVLIFKIIL